MSDWQTDGHWSRDWSMVIWAEGISYGQTWTFWTFDIVQCFTIASHCWYIRFHAIHNVSLKCWRWKWRRLNLRDEKTAKKCKALLYIQGKVRTHRRIAEICEWCVTDIYTLRAELLHLKCYHKSNILSQQANFLSTDTSSKIKVS